MGIPANIGIKFNSWYGGDGVYSIQLWIINAYCGCLTRLGDEEECLRPQVCLLEPFSLTAIGVIQVPCFNGEHGWLLCCVNVKNPYFKVRISIYSTKSILNPQESVEASMDHCKPKMPVKLDTQDGS